MGGSTTCRIMGAKKRFSQHSILNLFAVNIKNAVRSAQNKWAIDLIPKENLDFSPLNQNLLIPMYLVSDTCKK